MNKIHIDTKKIAALVRNELKAALPEWKFSVIYRSYSGGSSIDLALMQGPEQVIVGVGGYAQLNQYGFLLDDNVYRSEKDRRRNNGALLTVKGWEVMEKATKILAQYHYDDSNAQIDYFCCNFYMHVAIGKWDKHYTVRGQGLPLTTPQGGKK